MKLKLPSTVKTSRSRKNVFLCSYFEYLSEKTLFSWSFSALITLKTETVVCLKIINFLSISKIFVFCYIRNKSIGEFFLRFSKCCWSWFGQIRDFKFCWSGLVLGLGNLSGLRSQKFTLGPTGFGPWILGHDVILEMKRMN